MQRNKVRAGKAQEQQALALGLCNLDTSSLEGVLQSKFDLTIVRRSVSDACPSGHVFRDGGAAAGQSEVGMIEDVEEFRAEFHLLRLSNLEVLLQDKIEIYEIRAAKISDARAPEAVGRLLAGRKCRHCECRLVVPAVQCLVSGIGAAEVGGLRSGIEGEVIGIRNLIGAVAEASGVAEIGRQNPGNGFATL